MLKGRSKKTAAVRSERSRIYLQRSNFEKIYGIVLFANTTKSIKTEIRYGYG